MPARSQLCEHASKALQHTRAVLLFRQMLPMAAAARQALPLVAEHLEKLLRLLDIEPGATVADAERCAGVAAGQVSFDDIGDALRRAGVVTGSHDEFRELDRFALFTLRCRFARTVEAPNFRSETGAVIAEDEVQVIGPLIADDPFLPVRQWLQDRQHTQPVTVEEAVILYVEWQTEACALFMKRYWNQDSA